MGVLRLIQFAGLEVCPQPIPNRREACTDRLKDLIPCPLSPLAALGGFIHHSKYEGMLIRGDFPVF